MKVKTNVKAGSRVNIGVGQVGVGVGSVSRGGEVEVEIG